jgi:hypothetical protein
MSAGSMRTGCLVGLVFLSASLAASACVFPDMPTTPTSSEVPVDVADVDGGVSVEELVQQVEKLQEMEREHARLKARGERLKDELAELEREARERRAHHVQKFGIWANFVMLVVSVALATAASFRRRQA